MQEMRGALRSGSSLEDLWKVARGDIPYADFLQTQSKDSQKAPPSKKSLQVPDDLVRRGSVVPVYMNWMLNMLVVQLTLDKGVAL